MMIMEDKMSNKVIDYVMNSPQNTNPNVLKGLLESYEGGGASDFTTAEVTITNNTGSNIELALPEVEDNGRKHLLRTFVVASANGSHSLIVALYKGAASGRIITNNVPSAVCTGEASISSNNSISIKGNGTITFGTAS